MTSITFFLIFIPVLAIILLAINLIFASHSPYQEKNSVFECGFHSFLGQNRTQFSISFFIFALLFLLFDLEILLVYPYGVSSYTNDIYGLIIMLVFFLVLTLGFAFELGKKALKIDSRQTINNLVNNILNAQNTITLIIITAGSIKFEITPVHYHIFSVNNSITNLIESMPFSIYNPEYTLSSNWSSFSPYTTYRLEKVMPIFSYDQLPYLNQSFVGQGYGIPSKPLNSINNINRCITLLENAYNVSNGFCDDILNRLSLPWISNDIILRLNDTNITGLNINQYGTYNVNIRGITNFDIKNWANELNDASIAKSLSPENKDYFYYLYRLLLSFDIFKEKLGPHFDILIMALKHGLGIIPRDDLSVEIKSWLLNHFYLTNNAISELQVFNLCAWILENFFNLITPFEGNPDLKAEWITPFKADPSKTERYYLPLLNTDLLSYMVDYIELSFDDENELSNKNYNWLADMQNRLYFGKDLILRNYPFLNWDGNYGPGYRGNYLEDLLILMSFCMNEISTNNLPIYILREVIPRIKPTNHLRVRLNIADEWIPRLLNMIKSIILDREFTICRELLDKLQRENPLDPFKKLNSYHIDWMKRFIAMKEKIRIWDILSGKEDMSGSASGSASGLDKINNKDKEDKEDKEDKKALKVNSKQKTSYLNNNLLSTFNPIILIVIGALGVTLEVSPDHYNILNPNHLVNPQVPVNHLLDAISHSFPINFSTSPSSLTSTLLSSSELPYRLEKVMPILQDVNNSLFIGQGHAIPSKQLSTINNINRCIGFLETLKNAYLANFSVFKNITDNMCLSWVSNDIIGMLKAEKVFNISPDGAYNVTLRGLSSKDIQNWVSELHNASKVKMYISPENRASFHTLYRVLLNYNIFKEVLGPDLDTLIMALRFGLDEIPRDHLSVEIKSWLLNLFYYTSISDDKLQIFHICAIILKKFLEVIAPGEFVNNSYNRPFSYLPVVTTNFLSFMADHILVSFNDAKELSDVNYTWLSNMTYRLLINKKEILENYPLFNYLTHKGQGNYYNDLIRVIRFCLNEHSINSIPDYVWLDVRNVYNVHNHFEVRKDVAKRWLPKLLNDIKRLVIKTEFQRFRRELRKLQVISPLDPFGKLKWLFKK